MDALAEPDAPDHSWLMDFDFRLAEGWTIHTVDILDDFTCVGLHQL